MSARSIRNAVAAVVLTAAAAASGTACGSADDPERGRMPTVAESAVPTPEEPPATTDAKPKTKPKPESDDTAQEPSTVPKSELVPATGSFTKKQKEYLVDRVPRGTEPAAVLEAGQAVCNRITRTAKVDRKAAVSALKSGEIADPEAAVTHLCPKHKPLLEAAGLTDG